MAHPYQKFRDSSHSRVKQVLKAGGGGVPSVQPITPQVADSFQRAVRNAGSDEESDRLANVALKRYGVKLNQR